MLLLLLPFTLLLAPPCPGEPVDVRARYDVGDSETAASRASRESVLALMEAGDDRDALNIASALVDRDSALFGADHPFVILDQVLRGMLLFNCGLKNESRILARRTLSVPPGPPLFRYGDPAVTLEHIAVLLDTDHLSHRDDSLYRWLLAMLPKSGVSSQAARSALLFRIGLHQKVENRWPEARAALTESLLAAEERYGKRSPRLAEILNHLGVTETVLCNYGASRAAFVRAVDLALRGCLAQVEEVPRYLENYGWALREAGQEQEAKAIQAVEGEYRSQLSRLHP